MLRNILKNCSLLVLCSTPFIGTSMATDHSAEAVEADQCCGNPGTPATPAPSLPDSQVLASDLCTPEDAESVGTSTHREIPEVPSREREEDKLGLYQAANSRGDFTVVEGL